MKKKTPELTTQEMAAARLMLDTTKKQGAVAKELGVSVRTLTRWLKRPEVIAYQDQVRAEQDKKLEARTDAALKKIDFSKADGIAALVKIVQADGGQPTAAAQIKAIEVLANMLGWAPAQVFDPGVDGYKEAPADKPKPTFYRAAWRPPLQ